MSRALLMSLAGEPLTPRECEVVELVQQALSNRKIADKLGITEGAVKGYVYKVFQKTGVVSRTELAVRASEWIG